MILIGVDFCVDGSDVGQKLVDAGLAKHSQKFVHSRFVKVSLDPISFKIYALHKNFE